ncbi:hypothetical protein [Vibrio caribbeanicus]|uniref:hypothetical protein n=1 Tax=Vibrio caribbeanicus TaxID=701175 RepID=UPI002283C175|nr:hypothetical protein [Vibrio caribbeanicus]MCY9845979.1 hypothetical protein [Vibrio caribbeanicus]
MASIFAFVKLFENKEYAEDFVNGKLFMNTIRSFKEYRDKSGELRGDDHEGIIAMYQPSQLGELKLGDVTILPSELAAPIVIHGEHLLNQNVFCIYSLNSRGYDNVSEETIREFKKTLELHNSCFGLGKYCVVVTNASEFIKRCQVAIKSKGFHGSLGLVDYFDEREFHGEMPLEKLGYQKRSMFKEQREYRIKIDTMRKLPDHYTLNVGDLSDITALTTPAELNEKLEIKLPDGTNA